MVGSLNVDLVVRLPRLPQPGETLTARSLEQHAGGKGGNQAAAAARLAGPPVTMVGCVGDDAHGAWLVDQLELAGVAVSHVRRVAGIPTGTAVIAVDDGGQNHIVIVAGANGCVDVALVDPAVLRSAQLLLLQLEIPLAAVQAAAGGARSGGATVILDPAPAAPLPRDLLALADWVTPNETELLVLAGEPASPARVGAEDATGLARRLQAQGARQVLVKLGDAGALLVRDDVVLVPALAVQAVDTTAAGDCFNAAFAVALAQGDDAVTAARYACAAAACSVTRPGAQASLPRADEVAELLRLRA